jgi:hypothetical protein
LNFKWENDYHENKLYNLNKNEINIIDIKNHLKRYILDLKIKFFNKWTIIYQLIEIWKKPKIILIIDKIYIELHKKEL